MNPVTGKLPTVNITPTLDIRVPTKLDRVRTAELTSFGMVPRPQSRGSPELRTVMMDVCYVVNGPMPEINRTCVHNIKGILFSHVPRSVRQIVLCVVIKIEAL